jgi:hypothetical protein
MCFLLALCTHVSRIWQKNLVLVGKAKVLQPYEQKRGDTELSGRRMQTWYQVWSPQSYFERLSENNIVLGGLQEHVER